MGDHIRQKRLDAGILQKELAAQLGVDKTTISKWERNLTTPAIWLWPGVIGFLGCDPQAPGSNLSERLRAYRWVRGLSQSAMAKAFGVSECSVRGWEAGRHVPCPRLQSRLEILLLSEQ